VSRSVNFLLRRLALTGLAIAALTTGNVVAQTTTTHTATAAPKQKTPFAYAAAPKATTTPPQLTTTAAPAPHQAAAAAQQAAKAPQQAAAALRQTTVKPTAQAARAARMRSYRIVAVARAQQGKPYRFGARGPNAFDCSGLSGFAYRKVHLTLPRTANDQYHATKRIPRSAARPGDLVFWLHGGHAYHVGIYAGNGRVWHAPKPGSRVKLAPIFSPAEVRFGRVGR
jgi:cell wall-associated NlpC family hydrolase